MREYFETIYEAVTDVSPNEIMGALLVGLVIGLVGSGLCMLGRKWKRDPFPWLCGLILLVSAGSMALGMGHARFRVTAGIRALGWTSSSPRSTADIRGGHPPGPPPFGKELLGVADADNDGRLTPEEVTRFIEKIDTTGKGWADLSDLDHWRQAHAGPNPQFFVSPPVVPSDEPRREGL
jgi:hypothetical protein